MVIEKKGWHNLSDEEYEKLKREVTNLWTDVYRLSEELGKPLPVFGK